MAQKFDDSIDSPVLFDGQHYFTGGQNSRSPAHMLKEDEAALLQDCQRDQVGRLSSRYGTNRPYATSSGKMPLVIQNYTKTLDESASGLFALNWVGTPGLSNVNLYAVDGSSWTSKGVISTYSAGTPHPYQRGGATSSQGGSIVQGVDKLYACFYIPSSNIVNPIYSWNGTTLSSLGGAGPGNASILLWHTSRLVASGPGTSPDFVSTVPDAIYFSDILDPATWGTSATSVMIRVGAGDGQSITALTAMDKTNIAVFKERSTYVVNADPQLAVYDFPIQKVHSSIGCAAHRSAVQAEGDILFLAIDGVHSLNSVIASEQQNKIDPPMSYRVQDVIDRITPSAIGASVAVAWNGLYILSVPVDGSTVPNHILVYNILLNSWDGEWTNISAGCFAGISKSDGRDRLAIGLNGSSNGEILEYLDYVAPSDWTDATFRDYNNNLVLPRLKTRAFIFDDEHSPKLGMGGELEWTESSGSFVVTPVTDDTSRTPITLAGASDDTKQFDLLQYGEFRELQLDISTTGAGRKEIHQIGLAAMPRATTVGNS